MTKKSIRRGLVIGCGGVAGGAWATGILSSLQDKLKWDPRDAEVFIGTSGGAVLVPLLAGGVSVERLVASQRGDNTLQDCTWDHDTGTGGWKQPLPGFKLTAFGLAIKGLQGKVSPLTAVCGALPVGQTDMTPLTKLVDIIVPAGDWVDHPATWLMAVDAKSGERVALGSANGPKIPLNKAVCASFAVPSWCPPVKFEGRTYIDGGIASPTSADLMLDTDVEEVILIAPMASRNLDNPRSRHAKFERWIRKYMTGIVDKEESLLKQAGKRVIRIEPGPKDLAAFGGNLMDTRRRKRVFDTAMETASLTIEEALESA